MTSARQLKANRANARASTGPRSVRGKARASKNSLRHALSVSIHAQPALSRGAEELAREIAGEGASAEIFDCARRIAEAQVDLLRVRQARQQMIACHLDNPNYTIIEPFRAPKNKMQILGRLVRYFIHMEKYKRGKKRRAPIMPEVPPNLFDRPKIYKPDGPTKFADILYWLTRRLVKMDRYERRVLSRRKFAIRDLDTLRQQVA